MNGSTNNVHIIENRINERSVFPHMCETTLSAGVKTITLAETQGISQFGLTHDCSQSKC